MGRCYLFRNALVILSLLFLGCSQTHDFLFRKNSNDTVFYIIEYDSLNEQIVMQTVNVQVTLDLSPIIAKKNESLSIILKFVNEGEMPVALMSLSLFSSIEKFNETQNFWKTLDENTPDSDSELHDFYLSEEGVNGFIGFPDLYYNDKTFSIFGEKPQTLQAERLCMSSSPILCQRQTGLSTETIRFRKSGRYRLCYKIKGLIFFKYIQVQE